MWNLALAIGVVIDVVLIAWGCRAIARAIERSAEAGVAHAVCNPWINDDHGAFESSGDHRYSHGLLTNPVTGLPMLEGVWVDVAGNPYGTDLAAFEGSSSFGTRFGGVHEA